MTTPILAVKQLGKIYRKHAYKHRNIRDDIAGWWKNLLPAPKKEEETINALADVSFELERGDVLGIIGRNGAGKSTLLKILAGVVLPTTGQVLYQGRLASILELGAGFHADLTGRENVYLNGSLLGMSKAFIRQQFDEIVQFSELGDFINEPVKNYSNGMYLRLAFSIFTHFTADILLLDEVMSVGDVHFRQKSYHRIMQLANAGTTVLIVSHNPDQIKDFCQKCLWLEQGKVAAFGPVSTILDEYLEKALLSEKSQSTNGTIQAHNYTLTWTEGLSIKDELKIFRYGIKGRCKSLNAPLVTTDDLEIEIEFEKLNDRHPVEITISILSLNGAWVFVDSYALYAAFDDKVKNTGRYLCRCSVPAGIINFGIYQLGFMVSKQENLIYQDTALLHFKIHFAQKEGINNHWAKATASIIKPMGTWEVQLL